MKEQIQLQVPLDSLKKRKCHCGCEIFIPAVNLHEVSEIVSPNGKAGVIFADAGFVCLSCCIPADLTPPNQEDKKLVVLDGGKGGN